MTETPEIDPTAGASPSKAAAHPESARADRVLGLIFLAAVLPLFVDVARKTMPVFQLVTGFGEPDVAGSRLHLVLPFVAALALVALLRKRPSLRRPLPAVVLLLVLHFSLSITWGLLNGAGLIGFVFFVQTIVPLVAWLAAYRVAPTPRRCPGGHGRRARRRRRRARLYDVQRRDRECLSSIALEDPFPQYRAYYPALVALGIALAVAYVKTDRLLSVATITVCLLLLPIMWSRAGILMVVVAFVASIVLCHFRGMAWRRRFRGRRSDSCRACRSWFGVRHRRAHRTAHTAQRLAVIGQRPGRPGTGVVGANRGEPALR